MIEAAAGHPLCFVCDIILGTMCGIILGTVGFRQGWGLWPTVLVSFGVVFAASLAAEYV